MIAITTPDKLVHYLEDAAAIALVPSPNTRAALQAAYDEGHWEHYTPPEPEPEPPPPNWTEFRLALMVNPAFRAWGQTLPDDWREDLKGCAILANSEALQGTYNHLVTYSPPAPEAAAEWQAIADANHIPVTFSDA